MKIKNLIAVAALLMGSTNAFAQGPGLGAEFAKGGLIYATSNIDAEKLTADAEVAKVSDNANGQALIDAKAIEIPATLTVDVDDETWTITVVGVAAGWESAGLDATGIETLSVDETNFTAVYEDFSAFTALKNVTVVDNEETPQIFAIPTLTDALVLETLDIEKCTGITAIPDNQFNGGKLASIKVPATITYVGDNAFKDCEGLSAFAFNKDLTNIGEYAFSGTALAAADLTAATGITDINEGAFQGTAITSFIVPKGVFNIWASAFDGCANLATVTFEAESACIYIGDAAFQGTALSSIELPDAITVLNSQVFAKTKFTEFTFKGEQVNYQAFGSCTSLKTFNFPNATDDLMTYNIDNYAFAGCIYPVTLVTSMDFAMNYGPAPANCKWQYDIPEPETISIKDGFGKWYSSTVDIMIDPEDAKVYSVYVDNDGDGTAYFQGLKIVDGMYQIPAGTHVIVKSSAEKVEYVDFTYGNCSVLVDHMFTFDPKTTLADFQTGASSGIAWDLGPVNIWWPNDYFSGVTAPYLYRLTNKNGIGFAQFTGVDIQKNQFFIQSTKAPDAAGRLNVVWVEDDATAIKGVKKAAAEAGAIYNLSGQKVNASYKGVVIKEGKKYIQK